jgi:hypothetical protein
MATFTVKTPLAARLICALRTGPLEPAGSR